MIQKTEVGLLVLALLGLWIGTAAWQESDGGWSAVTLSHGLIIASLGTVVFFRLDIPALLRSLPLLAPLSLLVLLIPLLTTEVWQAASALSAGNVAVLALLLVLPVLVILYARLRGLVFQAYGDTSQLLAQDESALLLHERIKHAASQEDADWLVGEALPVVRERITAAEVPQLALTVASTLTRRFHQTLARRLLPTAALLGLFASAYLYAVAAAAVPRRVAEHWSGEMIPTTPVDLIVEITFPGGPYIEVAVFLGIAATAIFLALVITDERYSGALTDALLHQPAYRSLVLGVPYLVLSRDAESSGDQAPGTSS